MPTPQETRAIGVYAFMDRCFRHHASSVAMLPHDRFAVTGPEGSVSVRVRTSSYSDWQEVIDLQGDFDVMVLINVRDLDTILFVRRDDYLGAVAARHQRYLDRNKGKRPRTEDSTHTVVSRDQFLDAVNDWSAVGLPLGR